MDILGINSSADNVFIKHSSADKCWMIGEEIHEDIVHILVDPATIQTGWGIYEGGYNWVWDEKPGVSKGQPSSDYKRAFSIWIYSKEHGSKIWRRFSWGEGQGFNNLCSTFWNDIKANEGKVVHVKYTGATVEKFKVGQAAIPLFEFVKWTEKPAEFASYDMDMPMEQAIEEANNSFDFAEPSPKPTTEDDLPF